MKKPILLIIVMIIGIVFCSCGKDETKSAQIVIGNSEKFSKTEINKAVDCVKKNFNRGFADCKASKIEYNEETSELQIDGFVKDIDNYKFKGVKPENIIVLQVDFKTGENPPTGLNNNNSYVYYMFVMTRSNSKADWKVVEYGY